MPTFTPHQTRILLPASFCLPSITLRGEGGKAGGVMNMSCASGPRAKFHKNNFCLLRGKISKLIFWKFWASFSMQKLSLLIYLWNIAKICFICIKPASRAPQCSHICCVRAIWYGCSPASSLPPSNPLPPSPPPPFFNKWLARGREGHTARGGIRQSWIKQFCQNLFPLTTIPIFTRRFRGMSCESRTTPYAYCVCMPACAWLFQPSPPPQEMKEVPRNGRSHAEDLLPYKSIPTSCEKVSQDYFPLYSIDTSLKPSLTLWTRKKYFKKSKQPSFFFIVPASL